MGLFFPTLLYLSTSLLPLLLSSAIHLPPLRFRRIQVHPPCRRLSHNSARPRRARRPAPAMEVGATSTTRRTRSTVRILKRPQARRKMAPSWAHPDLSTPLPAWRSTPKISRGGTSSRPL